MAITAGAPSAQSVGKGQPELQCPSPDRLVRKVDPPFGQQFLDISVAERKAKVEPDRVLNDLRGKAMAIVTDFSHRSRLPPDTHDGQQVTVTIPYEGQTP